MTEPHVADKLIAAFPNQTIRAVRVFEGRVVVTTDKGTYRLVEQTVAGVTVKTWQRVYVA